MWNGPEGYPCLPGRSIWSSCIPVHNSRFQPNSVAMEKAGQCFPGWGLPVIFDGSACALKITSLPDPFLHFGWIMKAYSTTVVWPEWFLKANPRNHLSPQAWKLQSRTGVRCWSSLCNTSDVGIIPGEWSCRAVHLCNSVAESYFGKDTLKGKQEMPNSNTPWDLVWKPSSTPWTATKVGERDQGLELLWLVFGKGETWNPCSNGHANLSLLFNLPPSVCEKSPHLSGGGGRVWNAPVPLRCFPGQKGRIWDSPLTADKFM